MRCVRWIARAHNFGRLQITVFRYRGEAWSCWLEDCRARTQNREDEERERQQEG